MIYEIRTYEASAGRSGAPKRRFTKKTMPLFERHGSEVLGVFAPRDSADRLVYITRFAEEAARTQAWAGFQSDPEWQAAKSASEKEGPLLASQTVTVLDPLVGGLTFG